MFLGFGGLLFTLLGRSFQTRAFPMVLLIILMLLCLVLIFRKSNDKNTELQNIIPLIKFVLLIGAYAFAIPICGFIISTTVFLIVFQLFEKNEIKLHYIILISLVIAFALYFLFAKGFNVRLPEIIF